MDTFSTLEDGQPAGPGDWELQLDSGWETGLNRSDAGLLTPAVKYTPHRYTEAPVPLLENMQLRLTMPFELGNGQIERNADLNFGVQERWIAEHDGIPSFSTLGEIRMPTGRNSNGADGTFTAITAKDLGPGTVLLNGWVRSANGDDIDDVRHFQWGLRLGYKWRITDRFAVVGDLVHQSSEQTGHGNIDPAGARSPMAHRSPFVFRPRPLRRPRRRTANRPELRRRSALHLPVQRPRPAALKPSGALLAVERYDRLDAADSHHRFAITAPRRAAIAHRKDFAHRDRIRSRAAVMEVFGCGADPG